jgi:hypothetical protein
MKTKLSTLFVVLLFGIHPSIAQNFSVGIESGINFSNINKSLDFDRYRSQPGPVNGMFIKYNLGNWFVVQSGINHTTFYFSEIGNNQYYPSNSDMWHLSSSSYSPVSSLSYFIPPPNYYNQSKFSFLRVPLFFKFKTPGKVYVELGGGAYYSFLTNDEFRGKDKNFYNKEYREENFPPMNDWGWILSSTINYNINSKWHVFINGQITTGKEEYVENVEGKMGSTELTFGVGYRPFLSDNQIQSNDSLGKRIRIIPHAGIVISNARNSYENGSQYKSSVGFSSGISLNFNVGDFTSLMSGAWYERKGYQLNYNGSNPLIYRKPYPFRENYKSKIQSNVKLDYITIPFQFEVVLGKKSYSKLNFGTYFSLLQNAFSEGDKIETNMHDQGFQTTRSYFYESFDEYFKKADAGFSIGYRLDIPVFSRAEVFVAINQSFGLINILKEKDDQQSNSYINSYDKIRNNSSSILVGLNIPVTQN